MLYEIIEQLSQLIFPPLEPAQPPVAYQEVYPGSDGGLYLGPDLEGGFPVQVLRSDYSPIPPQRGDLSGALRQVAGTKQVPNAVMETVDRGGRKRWQPLRISPIVEPMGSEGASPSYTSQTPSHTSYDGGSLEQELQI